MRTLLVAIALVALAIPADADHCTTWTTTTEGDLGPLVEVAGHYVLLECYIASPQGCRYSPYVYEESNGIAGLQRLHEYWDDTCHGMIEADRIVF